MLRKFLVFLLSFSLLIPSAGADEDPVTALQILDIPAAHWADGYARYLVKHKFMNLSTDGYFYPDQVMTRGEMVEIILRQIGVDLEMPETPTFTDVDSSYPLFAAVETAYKLGIVRGVDNEDGTLSFFPNKPVTRAQFVKIILEANQVDIPAAVSRADFADVAVGNWETPYVHVARQLGFINGYLDGRFGPEDDMTRAQVAKVVYLFLASTDQIVEDIVINAPTALAREGTGASAYEDLVLSLINASRSEIGKQALVLNGDLSNVARAHAQWLANNNIGPQHEGEGGSSPFDRLALAEIDYAAAGENVGWSTAKRQEIPAALSAIHAGMMAETDNEVNHRTNILGSFHEFNEVGIGVVVTEQAGSREVRVVQVFIENR